MLVPLVLVLALHTADKNEAEQQFQQMEMKLANAKNLACTYEAKFTGGKETGSLKGSLALADGNKSRLEMIGPGVGPDANLTLISNGEKMTALQDKSGKQQTTPKWLNDAYRATLARSGIAVPLLYVHRVGEEPKEFKVDDEFKVSDFQLGKKEMVGDREVQAIKYNLTSQRVSRTAGDHRVDRHENQSAVEACDHDPEG